MLKSVLTTRNAHAALSFKQLTGRGGNEKTESMGGGGGLNQENVT